MDDAQPRSDPGGTEVTLLYRVSGSVPDAEKVAPLVDQVLGEQLRRYAAPPGTR